MPAALLPAPHAGRVPSRAQRDTQRYSRRQVGLGVQWPSDWQALAGSPSSRNPGRQLYRTTEPTHQSLPYTTELKSASGRPQFTGDREVPMGSVGLAPCAACSAERQPKEMHPDKVAGPEQGPGCWAGSVGAPGCVPLWPEDLAAGETPRTCVWHKTCPSQAGCAKPCSDPQGRPRSPPSGCTSAEGLVAQPAAAAIPALAPLQLLVLPLAAPQADGRCARPVSIQVSWCRREQGRAGLGQGAEDHPSRQLPSTQRPVGRWYKPSDSSS